MCLLAMASFDINKKSTSMRKNVSVAHSVNSVPHHWYPGSGMKKAIAKQSWYGKIRGWFPPVAGLLYLPWFPGWAGCDVCLAYRITTQIVISPWSLSEWQAVSTQRRSSKRTKQMMITTNKTGSQFFLGRNSPCELCSGFKNDQECPLIVHCIISQCNTHYEKLSVLVCHGWVFLKCWYKMME